MNDILDYLTKTDHLKTIESIKDHALKANGLKEIPFERWDSRYDKWIGFFKEKI